MRHLIRVMRGHELTNKIMMTMTKTNRVTRGHGLTNKMTKTNRLREHLQRATLETCDLWDIWSEWWGDMTWPVQIQRQIQRQLQRQWHRQSQRLVTFETLITILTIENLNSWQSLLPKIKSDTGQHSQFLRCFGKNVAFFSLQFYNVWHRRVWLCLAQMCSVGRLWSLTDILLQQLTVLQVCTKKNKNIARIANAVQCHS